MNYLFKKALIFWFDENGAETLEWVIVASIISGTIVISYYDSDLRSAIGNLLVTISNYIDTVSSAG